MRSLAGATPATAQAQCRWVMELMARCLQGSVLATTGHSNLFEAYCTARLDVHGVHNYGAVPFRDDVMDHLVGRLDTIRAV